MTLKLKDMFVVNEWNDMGTFIFSWNGSKPRQEWGVRSGRVVEEGPTHVKVEWNDDKTVKVISLENLSVYKLFGTRVDADAYANKKRGEYQAEQFRREVERGNAKAEREAAEAAAAKKKPVRRRRTR